MPEDEEEFHSNHERAVRLARLRRQASQNFENDDPSPSVSFAAYTSNYVRAQAKTFGGGSLQRLIMKAGL